MEHIHAMTLLRQAMEHTAGNTKGADILQRMAANTRRVLDDDE